MSIFALRIDAVAADGNEFPIGTRHHLLVLVPTHSPEDAMASALIGLADQKWREAELVELGPMGVAPASIASPVLREAALKAAQGHRAIVVYDKP